MLTGRLIRCAAIAGLLATGLGSCSDPTAPDRAPDLEGTITSVQRDGSQVTVLVEEIVVPADGYEAISLAIRVTAQANARVFVRQADGTLTRGNDSALTVGARILAWNSGIERRSNPPQWDATDVVVLTGGP